MRFPNVFVTVLALTVLILAANAAQKSDDNEGEQKSYGSKSKDPIVSSDSESFINSDSRSSLNSKSKSTVGSTFSENRRKTRGIPQPKVMPEGESVIIGESRQRKARSADDDNTNNETTPQPMENSTRSDSDNTDVTQEQLDDDSQGTVEDFKTTTKEDAETVTDTPMNSMEDSTTLEVPTDEREETPENSNEAEQTTITPNSHSTDEENHEDIEIDSKETTTVKAVEVEHFENEGVSTASGDNLTVLSSTESNDGDILQSSESSESSTDLTNLPSTEDSAVEEMTEVSTEDEFNMDSLEDVDVTDTATEIPKEYTTDSMDTTAENILSTEATVVSTVTTNKPTEKPKKHYNYLVFDDETNIPCTLANMSISLKVSYSTKHNRLVSSEFPVPETANASGTCGKKQSDFTLCWPSASTDNPGENRITFQIMNDGAFFYVSSIKVNITLDREDYSNAAEATMAGNSTDLRLFSAPLNSGSHVCLTTTEVPCGQIVLKIKDVSLVAYNDRMDHSDREQEVCQASKTVGIAAILGGLVAIAVTVGIVSSYVWYRKRANTFRSELP